MAPTGTSGSHTTAKRSLRFAPPAASVLADPGCEDAETVLRQGKAWIQDLWANDRLEQDRRPSALSRPSSASSLSGGVSPGGRRSERSAPRRRAATAGTVATSSVSPGSSPTALASNLSVPSLMRRVQRLGTWPQKGGGERPVRASAGLLEPNAQMPMEPHRRSMLARRPSGPVSAWEEEVALADSVARIPSSR